jgi:hypothetical protein
MAELDLAATDGRTYAVHLMSNTVVTAPLSTSTAASQLVAALPGPYVGRLGRPRRTALWSQERVHTRQGQPARHGKRQAVITGMHHSSVSVADVDRSMAFYREFGFELVSDREVEGDYVR